MESKISGAITEDFFGESLKNATHSWQLVILWTSLSRPTVYPCFLQFILLTCGFLLSFRTPPNEKSLPLMTFVADKPNSLIRDNATLCPVKYNNLRVICATCYERFDKEKESRPDLFINKRIHDIFRIESCRSKHNFIFRGCQYRHHSNIRVHSTPALLGTASRG